MNISSTFHNIISGSGFNIRILVQGVERISNWPDIPDIRSICSLESRYPADYLWTISLKNICQIIRSSDPVPASISVWGNIKLARYPAAGYEVHMLGRISGSLPLNYHPIWISIWQGKGRIPLYVQESSDPFYIVTYNKKKWVTNSWTKSMWKITHVYFNGFMFAYFNPR